MLVQEEPMVPIDRCGLSLIPINEPMAGFEPAAYRLRGDCSTAELHWPNETKYKD